VLSVPDPERQPPPDERFDKHKAGIKSNSIVRRYGLRLLPELYECFNPMPYQGARDMEIELAIGLRDEGGQVLFLLEISEWDVWWIGWCLASKV
jgi:hypothetical protein